MRSGAEDLEQWAFDLIRQGLAVLDGQSDIWHEMAARMVDAKMGGIAHKLRYLETLNTDDWPEKVLEELGRLYLLTQGFQNFEKLPDDLKLQLQLVAGLTIRKKDLLLQEGLLDDWLVLGNWQGVNVDQAAYRKVWMQGKENQRTAMLLEYDYRGAGFEGKYPVGKPIKAALVFYPGAWPFRAAVKQLYPPEYKNTSLLTYAHLEAMQKEYAIALSKNPWLSVFPATIEKVIPLHDEGQVFLVDQQQAKINLETNDMAGWTLLSMSAGSSLIVFGEWRGDRLFPLSAFADGQFADLGTFNSVAAPNRFKRKFY